MILRPVSRSPDRSADHEAPRGVDVVLGALIRPHWAGRTGLRISSITRLAQRLGGDFGLCWVDSTTASRPPACVLVAQR